MNNAPAYIKNYLVWNINGIVQSWSMKKMIENVKSIDCIAK